MRRAAVVLLVSAAWAFAVPRASAAPVGGPVVFEPKPGTTLHVEGRGTFHGSLEVRREGGGVTVVNDLGLDDYVAGLREVPGLWPMEALKAQAVAARTYAMWEEVRGYWKRFGFDVCATTACQVYQGADAEQGERGRRWSQAAHGTAGEVLLYQGKPALARYHASSGGRTLPNEVVYPSGGKLPYLRAVDDAPDAVSPFHTWTVTFTRAELELILRAAVGLGGTLADVRATESERKVHISTLGGKLDMTSPRFRRLVSAKAPVIFPSRFPSRRANGQRYPETLPSSRFDITKQGDRFVVKGRGYGHGVGMSQWGAKGRAERGDGYADILAAYYSGLRPQPWTGRRTIRVAIVRGGGAVRIWGDGAFSVRAGPDTLASSTLGGWTVGASGARALGVTPPPGHELPLVLGGIRAPSTQLVDPPEQGGTLRVGFVVPKPAEVTGVVTRQGREVARGRVVVEAGERELPIPLDPSKLGRRETYRVELTAYDGGTRLQRSTDVELVTPSSALLWWAGGMTVLVALGFLLYRWRIRIASRP